MKSDFRDLEVWKLAKKFRKEILERTRNEVAVIITDTEGISPLGTLDFARGVSGIQINAQQLGEADLYGKPKYGGMDSIVDEIACASALLMGQTREGIPCVIMRGFKYNKSEEGISDYRINPDIIRKVIKEIIKHSVKALGWRWFFRVIK